MFTQAFADMQHTMDEVIAEGDAVVARWTVHSTHRGEFQGNAPTNKPVRMSGITVHHISNGRIAETWLVFDTMALLQQLGAVPGPAQA
jgi:predicted ester cyclase